MDEVLLKQSIEDAANTVVVPATRPVAQGESRAWTTSGQPD